MLRELAVTRIVAIVALGTALVLAVLGCGGSTSAFGRYRILLVGHGDSESRIVLWRPGAPATPLTPDEAYGDSCLGSCFTGLSEGFWSPDGRSIAYEMTYSVGTLPPDPSVFVMRSDGTNLNHLTVAPDSERAAGPPSWSPDGRQIVFSRYLDSYYGVTSQDFEIVDVRSRDKRTLPADVATGDPVWGKPGIAYRAGSRVMLLNPATGRSRLITRAAIAYPAGEGEIVLGGSGQGRILKTEFGSGGLAWSPGGVLAVAEPTQIVLLAASGRVFAKVPLPAAASPVCAIAWSPNGKQILAATAKDRALEGLWVGTVSTKRWQRLPTVPLWKKDTYDCAISWR